MSQPASSSASAPPPEKAHADNVSKDDAGLPQPAVQQRAANKRMLHPSVIIAIWIAFSSGVIVYNKYVEAYTRR